MTYARQTAGPRMPVPPKTEHVKAVTNIVGRYCLDMGMTVDELRYARTPDALLNKGRIAREAKAVTGLGNAKVATILGWDIGTVVNALRRLSTHEAEGGVP